MTRHEQLVAETLALCDELKVLQETDSRTHNRRQHAILRRKIREHRRQIKMHVLEWRKRHAAR